MTHATSWEDVKLTILLLSTVMLLMTVGAVSYLGVCLLSVLYRWFKDWVAVLVRHWDELNREER